MLLCVFILHSAKWHGSRFDIKVAFGVENAFAPVLWMWRCKIYKYVYSELNGDKEEARGKMDSKLWMGRSAECAVGCIRLPYFYRPVYPHLVLGALRCRRRFSCVTAPANGYFQHLPSYSSTFLLDERRRRRCHRIALCAQKIKMQHTVLFIHFSGNDITLVRLRRRHRA